MDDQTNIPRHGKNESTAFDAKAWLAEFEQRGGSLMLDINGTAAVHCKIWRNSQANQARLAEMSQIIGDEELRAVVSARKDEACRFQPERWCEEFEEAGGWIYASEGRPWTGMPEQDDERALRMRNRLIPEEVAKLRQFLVQRLGLETLQ